MTNDEHDTLNTDWLAQVKANGWETPLRLTLDIMEPLGPFGAQVLWVLQPALGVFIRSDVLDNIARTLEHRDHIDDVRRQLDEMDTDA